MYKFLLSSRYFRSRFAAVAALLAVTFGVAMLFIVLSIMGGYIVKLRENIRGQDGHLQVSGLSQFGVSHLPDVLDAILAVDNVRAAAPYVERLAIYSGGGSFTPCTLKGIDIVRESEVSDLARYVLRPAEFESILERFPPGSEKSEARSAVHELIFAPGRQPLEPGELQRFFDNEHLVALLKEENPAILEALDGEIPAAALVASSLIIERKMYLGQIINVLTLGPNTGEPLSIQLIVAGVLQPPEFDRDSHVLVADLDVVKNDLDLWNPALGMYSYQGIRVVLKDPAPLETSRVEVARALEAVAPDLVVRTWEEQKATLVKAVQIEKLLVYFIVLILVFFTGSMILLMLILTVIEKTRDIGILISLGASPLGVSSIFLINGLVICLLGELCGLGLGYVFCVNINEIHDFIHAVTGIRLFAAEIYHMDRIPIAFVPFDLLLSTLPPVAIGLLASLIPAFWAPRRDPIQAIQYE